MFTDVVPTVEAPSPVAMVRQNLALQNKNKYGEAEAVANLLEQNRENPDLLVISFSRKPDNLAMLLEGEDKQVLVERVCGPFSQDKVIRSSRKMTMENHSGQSQGMRALYKKQQHFLDSRARGETTQSSFEEDLRGVRFTNRERASVQILVETVIADIMSQPSTIIVRGRTVDVIDSRGRGVRIFRNEFQADVEPFVGLIDSNVYTKHYPEATRQKLLRKYQK